MRTVLTALASALAIGLVTASGASAAADIEGVWSFQEGKVAVQPAGDGTFKGTVLTATSFSECPHPPGQLMWRAMALQPDGQYFGTHQWFDTNGGCALGGQGRTAWRVLAKPDGTRFLRICFAPPEAPDAQPPGVQPTIAPDGTDADAPAGCNDSSYLGAADTKPPPPPVANPNNTVTPAQAFVLPSNKRCVSRRNFRIRIVRPSGVKYIAAKVSVAGRQVPVVVAGGRYRTLRGTVLDHNRLTARVDLRGFPKGTFTVTIKAVTTTLRTVKGVRKYRTCGAKKTVGRPRV